MCGSFALACGGRVSHTAAWHAGKTLTYAVLGVLAGLIGHSVPGPTWVATLVSVALVVWFAAGLAGVVPEPALRIPGLTHLATRAATRGDLASRFLFGMATGLLPCGLVYATLGIAVASGDPLTGGLSMAAFGLATAPALAALGLGVRRMAAQSPWSRRVLAVLVLVAGLWVVFQRQGMDPERMMKTHGGPTTQDSVTSDGHGSAQIPSQTTPRESERRGGRRM
jgi:hypothetical protein